MSANAKFTFDSTLYQLQGPDMGKCRRPGASRKVPHPTTTTTTFHHQLFLLFTKSDAPRKVSPRGIALPALPVVGALISLRRKFNNQQNAQHTFVVHYKHLHPVLQLLVNFKLFSYYLTHMFNIRGLLLLN